MKSIGFRGEGKFERISWDEALNIIYKKLQKLKIQFGPESILYYRRYANLGIMKNCASGFLESIWRLYEYLWRVMRCCCPGSN